LFIVLIVYDILQLTETDNFTYYSFSYH